MSEEPDRVAMLSDVRGTSESLEKRLTSIINASAEETRRHFDLDAEKMRDDVKRVYDVVIAQNDRNEPNEGDHTAFRKQLDDHDVRILALEKNDRRV